MRAPRPAQSADLPQAIFKPTGNARLSVSLFFCAGRWRRIAAGASNRPEAPLVKYERPRRAVIGLEFTKARGRARNRRPPYPSSPIVRPVATSNSYSAGISMAAVVKPYVTATTRKTPSVWWLRKLVSA